VWPQATMGWCGRSCGRVINLKPASALVLKLQTLLSSRRPASAQLFGWVQQKGNRSAKHLEASEGIHVLLNECYWNSAQSEGMNAKKDTIINC
jgi:hypothetical protein